MRERILRAGLSQACTSVVLTLFLMQEYGSDKALSKGHWALAADVSVEELGGCVEELLHKGILSIIDANSSLERNDVPVSDYGLDIKLGV